MPALTVRAIPTSACLTQTNDNVDMASEPVGQPFIGWPSYGPEFTGSHFTQTEDGVDVANEVVGQPSVDWLADGLDLTGSCFSRISSDAGESVGQPSVNLLADGPNLTGYGECGLSITIRPCL